ncbi:MAG: MoxR family ATPase [Thermodesulfobacteriota bacterium]
MISNLPEDIEQLVAQQAPLLSKVRQEMGQVIVGQEQLVDRLLTALLCNHHVLIEGLPGLAKTLTVTTLAQTTACDFQRLQFTPDLLPGDLIGTLIYNPEVSSFSVHKGPIFTNLILADEINRAPAKVQSALLEAMQERQVTIGSTSYELAQPFMVLATQNPVEQEGTYPLPEAQVDRFMFKLKVDYPARAEELAILQRMGAGETPAPREVITSNDILGLQKLASQIHVNERLEEYIVDLVSASRQPGDYGLDIGPLIQYGASPRATIFLVRAAKANALLAGRAYATPHDVKTIAMDVLRHRLILTYEAEAEEVSSEELVARILEQVPVP